MEDSSKIPNLVRELARRGYSEGDLEKILGGNVLRVMREVEAASGQIQSAESGGHSDGPVAEKVYSVSRDVVPPQVSYNPQPAPPQLTSKVKREATARLLIVVDSKGNVRDVQVIKPVGLGLDEKAVDVVRTWKFRPATRNGLPVAVRVI